jgi:predicted MFS family arabinose efflux permease
MGWLGWTLTFLALGVLALVVLSLLALRLWRAAKALSRDLARASGQLAEFGSPKDLSEAP